MTIKPKTHGFDTLSLHAGARPDPATGARATPIYQSASFVFPDSDHAAALFNMGVLLAEFLDQRPQARDLFERFLRVAPSSGEHREMAEQYLRDIPGPDAPPPAPAEATE